MSDKKRKHAGEEGGRLSKKTQTGAFGQAGVVKFSVLEDVGEWAPAIGKWPYQFVGQILWFIYFGCAMKL